MQRPNLWRANAAAQRVVAATQRRLVPEAERQQQVIADFRDLPTALVRAEVIDRFHRLYYDEGRAGGTWHRTEWLGVTVWKCPLDLWIYQELVHRLRPDLIIETGTAFGGSALFLGCMCDLVHHGSVVSIDIAPQPDLPRHPRVRYVTASSIDDAVVGDLREQARALNTVMVILDSDHSEQHVSAELAVYAGIVTRGSYLIVEDTNVNGHPVFDDHGPGPMEAVERFLAGRNDFERDPLGKRFLLTFNPGGLLRRVQ
jgi:cephalosporin hydroxylase